MYTAYISHPDCLKHDTGPGHPECAQRLMAIDDQLIASGLLPFLHAYDAPLASDQQLSRVHDPGYIASIRAASPAAGTIYLDPDTPMSPGTLQAALRAAGAAVLATDLVMQGKAANAFCAVRPPGHHAERGRAMGFCIFNNVAVGAAHALQQHGLERVAILDFDVHHGNGTEAIFRDNPAVLLCSTFQHPFYPHSGIPADRNHIVNVPLAAGSDGTAFRAGVSEHWLPALARFQPQMIFVSAGFDAHREDDMAGLRLVEADYAWVTECIMEVADKWSQGRIVSTLEGGYALSALGRSVTAHIKVLSGN